MNEIKLGEKVNVAVSGFSGTVTSICAYLAGPNRYEVTAPTLHDGAQVSDWFYVEELTPA